MWGIALLLPVTSACQPLFGGERLRREEKENSETPAEIPFLQARIAKKSISRHLQVQRDDVLGRTVQAGEESFLCDCCRHSGMNTEVYMD